MGSSKTVSPPLTIGKRVEVRISMPGQATQVQAREDLRVGDRIWRAACRFLKLQPAQSEQIVQFIVAQQRALARSRR